MHTHVLVYEAGESGRIDGLAVKRASRASSMCLLILKCYRPNKIYSQHSQPLHFNKTTWVRASNPGLFSALVTAGQKVKEGMLLGNIKDPYGVKSYAITSKVHGYIIGINHAAVVNQGDAIFHVGSYDENTINTILFTLCLVLVRAQSPAEIINTWADAEQWKHAHVGIALHDINSGLLIAGYNHDKCFVPASSLKVLSSFATLDLLGKDFTYKTVLAYDGQIVDSVLTGNVYVIGSGDPSGV